MTKKQLVMFFIVLSILVIGIIFAEVKTAAKYDEYMNTLKSMQKDLEKETVISKASWYDYTLPSGWSSKNHLICATREFPRYSYIKVTNLDNGKWVICKKTDHGPNATIHPDRIVDLSSYAFSKVSHLTLGLFTAKIELCLNDCVKNVEKNTMFGG
mgnify:CR=1 FL=1